MTTNKTYATDKNKRRAIQRHLSVIAGLINEAENIDLLYGYDDLRTYLQAIQAEITAARLAADTAVRS